MAQKDYTGMLQQFGLPTVSPEEYEKQKARALYQQSVQGIQPNDVSMASMGARIGSLAAAHSNKGIDPETQKKFQLVQLAQQRMKKFQQESPEEWEEMSVEDRGMFFNKTLASSAFELGLNDIGASAAVNFAQQKRKRELQDKELQRLGMDIRQRQRENKHAAWEREIARSSGKPITIYPLNSTDPNSGREGMQLPNGDVVVFENGKERVLKPGTFTTDRPTGLVGGTSGGGGRSSTGLTPSAADTVRVHTLSLYNQMGTAIDMADLLGEAAAATGSVDFLAEAGLMQKFATSIANNTAAAIRAVGGTVTAPVVIGEAGSEDAEIVGYYNPDAPGDVNALVQKMGQTNYLRDSYESVFGSIRANSSRFQRWQAMVVRMAYARAMAREPGARQLSDADFKNAVNEIGAASTSPETFRQIIATGIMRDLDGMRARLMSLPDDVRTGLFGTGFQEMFDKREAAFLSRFGEDFGQPEAAGPGLQTGNPDRESVPGAQEEILPDGSTKVTLPGGGSYTIKPETP